MKKRETFAALDVVRGLAALAVLAYHIRYRFFFDWQDLADRGLVPQAFYVLTSFGHDAVIVFFVLSGFFISRIVMRDVGAGTWLWRDYLTHRLVRLYVVLIPGLVLTALWDSAGLTLFPSHPVYTGFAQQWRSDFFPVAPRLEWGAFAGNVAFLQTIAVPPFGSNEALWSLAFELWYYLIFPCLWLALFARQSGFVRVLYAVAGISALFLIGGQIALYFPVWLLGAVIAGLHRTTRVALSAYWMPLSWAIFGAVLVLGHSTFSAAPLVARDYAVGLAFTLVLFGLTNGSRESNGVGKVGTALAASSYTLYVVHLPVLVFLRAWLAPGAPWPADLRHIAYAVVLFLAVAGYAAAIAYVTERRTASIRRAVSGLLGSVWRPPLKTNRAAAAQP